MADYAKRFPSNPIFTPQTVAPVNPGCEVLCVLNPGAFRYRGRIGLLMRVAERPAVAADQLGTIVLNADNRIELLRVDKNDPRLTKADDPRCFTYDGTFYLTSMSLLRLAWSDDGGRSFTVDESVMILPNCREENFGIEDCRVTQIGNTYVLTYTAVSGDGPAVGMMTTTDWIHFSERSVILPPPNKDVTLFPRRIGGRYFCMHRPMCNGNNIWIADSANLHTWGNHHCLLHSRPGMWDSDRIGAGAEPIETPEGWLELYHGADHTGRYCIGAVLLDANDPGKVLARSRNPIMEPSADYECNGFFSNCIFTNGHVVDGDTVTVFYGASDLVICGAELSISEILQSLR